MMSRSLATVTFFLLIAVASVRSFSPSPLGSLSATTTTSKMIRPTTLHVTTQKQRSDAENKSSSSSSSTSKDAAPSESTTEKFGLEAGLMESLRSDKSGESAKSLLKKYGIAYLATSIPLALVSFALCYALVSNGVDVSALLSKVGIESSATADAAGTFAIAYAAHKAASPIRFPPTVLLTPIVAKAIGKEVEEE